MERGVERYIHKGEYVVLIATCLQEEEYVLVGKTQMQEGVNGLQE